MELPFPMFKHFRDPFKKFCVVEERKGAEKKKEVKKNVYTDSMVHLFLFLHTRNFRFWRRNFYSWLQDNISIRS